MKFEAEIRDSEGTSLWSTWWTEPNLTCAIDRTMRAVARKDFPVGAVLTITREE